MGVIDKLNALDDRAGVNLSQSARSWARHARWWWVNLAAGVLAAVAVLAWDLRPMAFFAVGSGFVAGFFYNERLRLLGRRSRWRAYRAPE